jgi:hypothetical protein
MEGKTTEYSYLHSSPTIFNMTHPIHQERTLIALNLNIGKGEESPPSNFFLEK